jgi:hypothetical protein
MLPRRFGVKDIADSAAWLANSLQLGENEALSIDRIACVQSPGRYAVLLATESPDRLTDEQRTPFDRLFNQVFIRFLNKLDEDQETESCLAVHLMLDN